MEKNRKVLIQISEPWDFELLKRGNVIQGVVEGVCHGPDVKNWQKEDVLVRVSKPFDWEGKRVKQLLLSSYFEGHEIKDILRGKEVSVSIAIVTSETSMKPKSKYAERDCKYAFIGGVKGC
jgi:hypothetical protein